MINAPVSLQSTTQESTISPLDYIIADLDGVVVLPADLAEQVLEVSPKIVKQIKCAQKLYGAESVYMRLLPCVGECRITSVPVGSLSLSFYYAFGP